MRVGIIGYGNQARLHATALREAPDVEIAGIGALDPPRALRFAHKFGTQAYTTHHLIESERIDALVIATPTSTHAAIACAALARGKHVFCECPIAPSLQEADAMVDAARASGRVLQIGLVHRFEEPYRHLVNAIRSAAFGRVHAIETLRLSAHVASGEQKPHHGDAIEELLTFDLHFLAWAFGRPTAIQARSVDIEGKSRHVAAVVSYPMMVASCTASSFLPAGHPFTESMRVFTDEGLVELSLELGARSARWRHRITRADGAVERFEVPEANPIAAQMLHFVNLVSGRESESRASGADGRDMLELTLAAAVAARSGEVSV